MSQLLDQFGRPLQAESKRSTEPRELRARFDLAQTTSDNRRHWAAADSYSARSSLTPGVRKLLRERSRLEFENSSYYAGILTTAVNHIIGTGPRLQLMTTDAAVNRRCERAFTRWAADVGLTAHLQTGHLTYWKDGESFLLRKFRRNTFGIPLDIGSYESEQVQNPLAGSPLDPYVDDGIRIDSDGRPESYYFLDHHPSDPYFTPTWDGDWRKRDDVIHLFRPTRPGQIRGIPRATAGLPLLAVMRRFTMATVHAAESAALHAVVMKTTGSAAAPAAGEGTDFATVELERNMMTILPEGWDAGQIKPEHPTTTYEMFERQLLMQFCRCMNVPYGLAAGTSKDSNFSSHKGDIRNLWQSEVWAEQELIERTVLRRIFRWFLEDAAVYSDILDGMPPIDEIDYQWFWDGIPELDETDAANAKKLRMQSGQSTPQMEWSADGHDFNTGMEAGDRDFGLPPGTYKRAVFESLFPGAIQSAMAAQQAAAQQAAAQQAAAAQSPAAGAAPSPAATEAVSPGVMSQLGMRQFSNKQRATGKLLNDLIGGASEVQIRLGLKSLGWTDSDVDLMIADASDGVVDAPELQEVTA